MRFDFYTIEPAYCRFLAEYDSKVIYISGQKQSRPFIGVVFNINDKKYYAPLSSPKKKHLGVKNQIDRIAISDGRLGVINLNNMIPVHDADIKKINMNIAPDDDSATVKYKNLLKNQLTWCNANRDIIISNAKKLYRFITTDKAWPQLKDRCCDFRLLEAKYKEYGQHRDLGPVEPPRPKSIKERLAEAKVESEQLNAERAAGRLTPNKNDRER